jgi:hypothetical protein
LLRSVREERRLMATTQHSIRLVKQFSYRGDPAKEFSNRYYFDGGSPGDSDAWHTLMDAWTLLEKPCYPNYATIITAYGYAPGSEVAVATKQYAVDGTLNITGSAFTPGDCAAVLRQATTKKSTKNHTVYCFSYFHLAMSQLTGSLGDTLLPAQRTAIANFGNSLVAGVTVAGRTYKRTTPDGHLVTGAACDAFVGHRDFPR